MATNWAKTLVPLVFLLQTVLGQVMYNQRTPRQLSLQELLSPANAEIASQILRAGRQTSGAPPGTGVTNLPSGSPGVQLQPRSLLMEPRQPQIQMQKSIQRSFMPNIANPRETQQLMQSRAPVAFNPSQALPLPRQYTRQVPISQAAEIKPASPVPPQNQTPQSSPSHPPTQLPQTSDLPLQSLASQDPSQNTKREIFFSDKQPCNCDPYERILSNILPVGNLPSYPELSFKNEDFFSCPCSRGKSPNLPAFSSNPYLPVASPISALYSPVSAALPPANLKQSRCNFLRKIPIPPPMI